MRPRSWAACITAVDAPWKDTTPTPPLNSAMAASRSRGGSNQVSSQTTLTVALGLTERMPSVKALMPCSTSGIGKPTTKPATPVLLARPAAMRSEEHTSELQSQSNLVCRLLLEKKKKKNKHSIYQGEQITRWHEAWIVRQMSDK